jgi:hypothetical protein
MKMLLRLKNIDLMCMISLLLIEITIFILTLVSLVSALDSNAQHLHFFKSTIINASITLCVQVICMLVLTIFGIRALYFKIVRHMIWYIIR